MKKADSPEVKWQNLKDFDETELDSLRLLAAERLRLAREVLKKSREDLAGDYLLSSLFHRKGGYSQDKFKRVEYGDFGKSRKAFKSFLETMAQYYNIPVHSFIDDDQDEETFQAEVCKGWKTSRQPRSGTMHLQSGTADLAAAFDSFIDDRIKGFVGRQFVFDQMDSFIQDPDQKSGYVIIIGQPGIGKSSIIARLVRDRGWVHHFNIGLQGIDTPRHFIPNICAQIIALCKLDHNEIPPTSHKDGAFLNRILSEAAATLRHEDRLVVLLDALDEVRMPDAGPEASLLFLPPALPNGVFFVVTSRPRADLGIAPMNRKYINLEADADFNLADIRTYISACLDNPLMTRRRVEWKVTKTQFVEIMCEKSEGNFMYLRHVLPAIADGVFKQGYLDELPRGLVDYYRKHWARMKIRQDDFEGLYEPVLCILAAAREVISIDHLCKFTKLRRNRVQSVLRQWHEFLFPEVGPNGETLYRLYHQSFRDFLQNEVDPGLETYHRMISEYYLKDMGMLSGT